MLAPQDKLRLHHADPASLFDIFQMILHMRPKIKGQ